MKKIFLAFVFCAVSLAAFSQDHLRERVYLSTDKDVYVAGDVLWCSAYCVDVNTRKLSGFSNIAYVEIHSETGMVQTGKVALSNGRGAGRIDLLNTLPTGNYRILAYTAQSCNESGYGYLLGAKTISIFNPLSSERVKDGVQVVSDSEYAAQGKAPAQQEGGVSVACGNSGDGFAHVSIANNSGERVTLNLSVFHQDGIASPENSGISSFLSGLNSLPASPLFTRTRTPEYEGEIIRAKVAGTDEAGLKASAHKFAFFSTPSSKPNSYSSEIMDDGTVTVYTSNIYGNKEIFMEIEDLPEGAVCHLELESPFVNVPVGKIPALKLNSSIASKLEARSASMQIGRAFESDTLYDYLPISAPDLFSDEATRYNLDDYTRFPLMEEVITEFVTELRVRMVEGRKDIQVLMRDSYRDAYFSRGVSLAMVDGVPVFNQEEMLAYDPALIHYVDIYPLTYFIGKRCFSGVVNFVTYKGNLPSLKFADNVRIASFQGAAVPQAVTGEGLSAAYPDYRQTILWQPLVELEPGQSITLRCKTPAYSGRFDVVAEGVTRSLKPVYSQTFMELGPR